MLGNFVAGTSVLAPAETPSFFAKPINSAARRSVSPADRTSVRSARSTDPTMIRFLKSIF
jgi:hypothetical protein